MKFRPWLGPSSGPTGKSGIGGVRCLGLKRFRSYATNVGMERINRLTNAPMASRSPKNQQNAPAAIEPDPNAPRPPTPAECRLVARALIRHDRARFRSIAEVDRYLVKRHLDVGIEEGRRVREGRS